MTPDTYRQHRVSLNLTQGELADALGVSRSTIARRETGEVPITEESARALEGFVRQQEELTDGD